MWIGWLYQRGRWSRVCEGSTLGACSRHLGPIARERGVLDRATAMTTGGVPGFVPRSVVEAMEDRKVPAGSIAAARKCVAAARALERE